MDLKIILIFIPSKKKYMLISDVRMPTKFLLSFPEISKILFREIMLYLSSKVVSSHLTGSTTCGTAFLWKLNGILGFKFNISLGLPKKTGCPASRAIPAQAWHIHRPATAYFCPPLPWSLSCSCVLAFQIYNHEQFWGITAGWEDVILVISSSLQGRSVDIFGSTTPFVCGPMSTSQLNTLHSSSHPHQFQHHPPIIMTIK